MAWEIAIVGSVISVVLALLYLTGTFSEHPVLKLFFFFIGLFLISLSFGLDAHILEANIDSIDNSTGAYDDLQSNITTAYRVSIWTIIFTIAYWFIYLLLVGLANIKENKLRKIEA